jgi:hypothetical protein
LSRNLPTASRTSNISKEPILIGDLLLKAAFIGFILLSILGLFFAIRWLNTKINEKFKKFPAWLFPSLFFLFGGVIITLYPTEAKTINIIGLSFKGQELRDIKIALGIAVFIYALLEVPVFFDHLQNIIKNELVDELAIKITEGRRTDIRALLGDVFNYLFQVKHSPGTLKEIKSIISNPFVRLNYIENVNIVKNLSKVLEKEEIEKFIEITGQQAEASDNYYYFISEVSCLVHNKSSEPEKYSFIITVSGQLSGQTPYIAEMKFDDQDLIDDKKIKIAEITKADLLKEICIPKKILPGETKEIATKSIRMVRNFGRLPLFFSHITEYPKFIKDESAFTDFDIEIISNLSSEDKKDIQWFRGKKECKINRVFMPGQGIELFWSSKSRSTTETGNNDHK